MKAISKKVLSMLLVISFVLTMIPVSASAQTMTKVWMYVGDSGFTGASYQLRMTQDSGSHPYVAYSDYSHNDKASVKRYNGAGWENVGAEDFSSGAIQNISIVVTDSGTPYVAYRDVENTCKLVVQKFNGETWESIGTGLNCGIPASSISADHDGVPYVAYCNGQGNLCVIKYENSSWKSVGSLNVGAYCVSLKFDSENTPYVAYGDNNNGCKATVIKYNKETSNWETVGTAGGFSTGSTNHISLAFDGSGTPYVAYTDNGNYGKATVMKYNNTNWVPVGTAGISASSAAYTSLAIDGSDTPYVAYEDIANDYKATVKRYNAQTLSWETVGTAGFTKGQAEYTSIGIDDSGTPLVAYMDRGNDCKISVSTLTDAVGYTVTYQSGAHGSISDSISEIVASGSCPQSIPTPTADASYAFTGWSSDGGVTKLTSEELAALTICGDVTYTAYFKKEAFSWIKVGDPGFSAGAAKYTSLAADRNGALYAAYSDADNNYKATVMKYTEADGWKLVGNSGFSEGEADDVSLALDASGTPYVAYDDNGDSGSGKATVMKYDGSSWIAVGSAGFSAGKVNDISLAIDAGGMPYVIYEDEENYDKATVMKFDGSKWVTVGASGFSAGGMEKCHICIDANKNPFVLYQDQENDVKTTVKKYNGSAWETVGGEGFSPDRASDMSLAVDKSGIPYVAYVGGGYLLAANLMNSGAGNLTVMKYSAANSKWEVVGGEGISAGDASQPCITTDKDGTPYVAYRDGGNDGKATVLRYNGTDWESVGAAGFSAGKASYPSIQIKDGVPYVLYRDGANSNKTTVMKCLTNTSVVTYNAGANGSISGSTSETVNVGGKLKSIPAVTPNTGYEFAGWSCDGGKTLLTSAQLAALAIEDDVTYTACYKDKSGSKAVTGVTLNQSKMTLTVGGATGNLTATIDPVDASNKNVTWSSSDSGVASVSNGVVTPVAAGTAVITVTTADGGKTASCTVTVTAAGGGSDKHSGGSDTKAPSYNNVTKVDPAGNTVTVTPKADRVSVNGNTANIETVITNITTDDTGTSTNGSVADGAKKTAVTINVPTDAIKQQLAAKKDVELTVTVPSEVAKDTNPNLSVNINANKEILEAAKENLTDVTIQVKNADTQQLAYSWTFKGEDLAKSTVPVKDVNISMSVHLTTEVNTVNAVTPSNRGLVLSFDYSGLLPSAASVKISALEKGFKPGQTLYFYYYNPATKQIEPLDKNAYVVDANGNVTVQISHCSDYVLLPNAVRSLVLDTKNYTTATKDRYEIGVKLAGAKGCTVKVFSSAKGIASIARLKNGNYQVTGLKAGLTYIMFDVYDEKGKLISKAHASVRLTVEKGVKPSGDSHRQTALF
ncbi:MAG TPA: Ig-like domain-containing protein [Caproiciproducens sp.]|nr:Ig-like domain-containing protein [Caproiciproducens sp.]